MQSKQNMRKVYVYKRFERFWHWSQSALIFFLALTGFEVHDTYRLFGYENAVLFHRVAAYGLLGLIVFAIFWHFSTGEWKQYLPSIENMAIQIKYYTSDIFHNRKHPFRKSAVRKLNPLQAITYLSFKILIIPVIVTSGLLYMFHKTININNVVVISKIPLSFIANWHTFGSFILIAFILVHIYMTTTGHTPTSNIKAMLTGYEDIEDEETEAKQETEDLNNDKPKDNE